ncbi:hypothetical protein [Rugosimonospora africana]|uniref:hypothetical protein n=1 Tax=Rugosimonospora africana TaxID=556532 RepID=UPI001944002C|nr:hypothetical protein [Rugosimonospora africana]
MGELLDAVRAPALPEELLGEQRAVAQFVVAREGTQAAAAPGRIRRRVRRDRGRQSVGTVVLRLAALVAVLMTGSTVLAAETNRLPPVVQQRAHNLFSPLGVPAPSTAARPSVSKSPIPGGTGRSAAPRPDPSVTHPSDFTPVQLCQAWNLARKGPHRTTLPDPVQRALEAAAKGQPNIASFCAHVLSGSGKQATPTQPGATPTPDRTDKPGKGKGKGHTKR